ncbi:MAG: hypothetical protein LBG95_07055 [Treponema sp.]|nr:hypothetical protein [Treponema sp.]
MEGFEFSKVYKQDIPALRFIGIERDSNKGGWDGDVWDTFGKIEASLGEQLGTVYEDGDAYCSLYRNKEGEPFKWYVGIFTPAGSNVHDGLFYHDFEKSTLGVSWVYGKEDKVHGHWIETKKKLEETGYKVLTDSEGVLWCFERDTHRFVTPDEKGNVITDVCYFVEK